MDGGSTTFDIWVGVGAGWKLFKINLPSNKKFAFNNLSK
jgi:hypothetical protein